MCSVFGVMNNHRLSDIATLCISRTLPAAKMLRISRMKRSMLFAGAPPHTYAIVLIYAVCVPPTHGNLRRPPQLATAREIEGSTHRERHVGINTRKSCQRYSTAGGWKRGVRFSAPLFVKAEHLDTSFVDNLLVLLSTSHRLTAARQQGGLV